MAHSASSPPLSAPEQAAVDPEFIRKLAVHPSPACAADALIRDARGHILLVHPTYKDGWDLPGGMTEDEEVRSGLQRELREELGLTDTTVGRLLVHDTLPPHPYGRAVIAHIYAVHCASPPALGALVLQREEIDAAEFVAPDAALLRLPERLRLRVAAALDAERGAHCAQLLDGAPVKAEDREHYAQLSAPMLSAAALVLDAQGRMLVAEHSYRNVAGSPFGLPGGMVHAHETPRAGVVRELEEELGLSDVPVGRLLAIDSAPADIYGRALVVHVFAVGPLTAAQKGALSFQDGEILAAHWCTRQETVKKLTGRVGLRAVGALDAWTSGAVAELASGVPVPGQSGPRPQEAR